jgi:hypothetical protein
MHRGRAEKPDGETAFVHDVEQDRKVVQRNEPPAPGPRMLTTCDRLGRRTRTSMASTRC